VDQRLLAIAPQGTRRRGARFKSGFLRIARGARVPVVLAALDYGTRSVRFGPTFMPGEDIEAERARAEAYFAPIRGKRER
jgi:1-acyl-sn-glycerol-3-phosphate acyltransferase